MGILGMVPGAHVHLAPKQGKNFIFIFLYILYISDIDTMYNQ